MTEKQFTISKTMIMPQFGSLAYLKIVSSSIEDILYLKTFKEEIDTQLLIIVKPKYDKEVILKFADEHIPLGVMYKVIEVTDYLEQQDDKIKELEQELFEVKVEKLDDELAEYATSSEECKKAWQSEFGCSEREAKRKAGWDTWILYPEE